MRLATLVLAFLAAPVTVLAHGRSVSYSTWTLAGGGAHVELRLSALDATLARLDPWQDADALAAYAAERLVARHADRPCTTSNVHGGEPRDGTVVITWDVACDGAPDAIVTRLFDDTAPTHLHFAHATAADGTVTERVLTSDDARWALATTAAAPVGGSSFADYVRLGVEHIRTGYDHLAFVLALLLLAGSLREVAAIVSAFTVAHSVTLAVAVLGVVRPPQAAVEALIGFSIALVAAENVWLLAGQPASVPRVAAGGLLVMALAAVAGHGRIAAGVLVGMAVFSWCHFGLLARVSRPARLRVAVAFAFGLIHGFGFAGVLNELALPPGRLVLALGGFNLGVELGQLGVIALAWPLVRAAERAGLGRPVAELGSSALCGLGVFWLVVRAFAR